MLNTVCLKVIGYGGHRRWCMTHIDMNFIHVKQRMDGSEYDSKASLIWENFDRSQCQAALAIMHDLSENFVEINSAFDALRRWRLVLIDGSFTSVSLDTQMLRILKYSERGFRWRN